MHLTWPPKTVDENLDYQLDWTDALEGNTISISTWDLITESNTLTLGSNALTPTATEVRLIGGSPGYATVRNTVVLNDGQTMVADVKILIRI